MLIIEDGTGKEDSNSYVTAAELVTFAALRGVTIPDTAPEQEVLLIKGVDYVESFGSRLSGTKNTGTQAMQWPRTGATADGYAVTSTDIPAQLKKAQLQAALESVTTSLLGTSANPTGIKKEKVDIIETEYFERGASIDPEYPAIMAHLKLLFAVAKTGSRLTRR